MFKNPDDDSDGWDDVHKRVSEEKWCKERNGVSEYVMLDGDVLSLQTQHLQLTDGMSEEQVSPFFS